MALIVRKAAFIFLGFACMGHGRRVQPGAEQLDSSHAKSEDSKQVLAGNPSPQSFAGASAAYLPPSAPSRIPVGKAGVGASQAWPTSAGPNAVANQNVHVPVESFKGHREPVTNKKSPTIGNSGHRMSKETIEEFIQMKAGLKDVKDMLEEKGGSTSLTQKIERLETAEKAGEGKEVKVGLDDLRSQVEKMEVSQLEKQRLYQDLNILKWFVGIVGFGGIATASIAENLGNKRAANRASRSGAPQMSAVAAEEPPKGWWPKVKEMWPAWMPKQKELKKMLPLAFIFFCMLFNYTVLRDTKDVLVVTSGGAEVIPFLKTYLNLPAAIGFNALYFVMVNRMSSATIFKSIVTFFAIFFFVFAAIIFPCKDYLHPLAWATGVAESLPAGFGPIISIIKFWTFGAFYTFAELWGSVVVSLLFWGFANSVCSVSEGKRWYPLFGMIANVALIFSGQFVRRVSKLRENLPVGVDPWGYSLKILMTAILVGAGVILAAYSYMQRYVLTDPECVPPNMERKTKKKKEKMGMRESIKYLAASSYIRNLFFLVIAYGTSINIVEVTWKGKLKQAFPNPNDYSSFMGAFSSCTGAVTLVMMLIGRWILTRFGWGVGALVTPCILGITGITFFSLILFKDAWAPLTAAMGLSPLMMAVFVGAAQNILSKASKYSLFDPCKETAYIPLDKMSKTKGKAAIDVIGNPLGKSGGAFIQQLAILATGSLAGSAPLLGGVLFCMIGLWIKSANELAVEFEEKAADMEKKEGSGAEAS